MLKGFITLVGIFSIGIMLMAFAMPQEFATVRGYAKQGYDELTSIFNKDTTPLTKDTQVIEAPEPLLKLGKDTNVGKLNIDDIIDETNKQRIAHNLPPLQKDNKLEISAQMKAEDMLNLQYFEHESPNGVNVSDLGNRVGYDYLVMGENLALGNFDSATELLDAWMASPGHRANILNQNFQDIGVYAVYGNYHGQKVWFAVQHFGTPKSVCPSISDALRTQIDTLNKTLSTQEKLIQQRKALLEEPGASLEADYGEQVSAYNKLVSTYNNTVLYSRQKTTEYNAEVNAFNRCLVKYQ